MRTHQKPRLASEGSGPPAKRKLPIATPPKVGQPRPPRDWSNTNQRLVERGDVELWVDVSYGPGLIEQAAKTVVLAGVLADRAYDAARCYQAAREVGTRLFVPPKAKSRYG